MEPVGVVGILESIGIFDCCLVDFTEFMLAIALTQSGDLDERLALAFDMYDYNNTNLKISLPEKTHFFVPFSRYEWNGKSYCRK